METTKIKDEARRLVEELPEDATWDDLMEKIYVRQAIESGMEDSEAGRKNSGGEGGAWQVWAQAMRFHQN